MYFIFLIIIPLVASADNFETKLPQQKLDTSSYINWFKETLKNKISESKNYNLDEIKERNQKILSDSKPCFSGTIKEKYEVMIFMSFSIPLSLWKEYSESLEKTGGAFVIRGLPEDSFEAFAKALKVLREKGIYAPIIINPKHFEKFEVNSVPTIICVEQKKYDKISGTISLRYALEKFSQEGDTKIAKKISEEGRL